MRIEALISAADAAGYAMVSDESSGDFGADEKVADLGHVYHRDEYPDCDADGALYFWTPPRRAWTA